MNNKLRLYHFPQVPTPVFYYEVANISEAATLATALGKYDLFLFKNGLREDYSNSTGLEIFENGEWSDWYDEESGKDFSEWMMGE